MVRLSLKKRGGGGVSIGTCERSAVTVIRLGGGGGRGRYDWDHGTQYAEGGSPRNLFRIINRNGLQSVII
jgi:hypothetical protein